MYDIEVGQNAVIALFPLTVVSIKLYRKFERSDNNEKINS